MNKATHYNVAHRPKKWKRLQALARIFFAETLTLIRNSSCLIAQSKDGISVLTAALRAISTVETQKYGVKFGKIRALLLKTVAKVWSATSVGEIRLLAFLYMRNACALGSFVWEGKVSGV